MGPDFQAQRIKMVDGQLRTTDVTGHALLQAFLEVPREMFVPQAKRDLAYLDADIELSAGRYLVEASPFAKMLSLAEIGAGDRVLDVGCGTGYSTAILAKLSRHVIALESDAALAELAQANLAALGLTNAEVISGELSKGAAQAGPFDVIVLSGSVSAAPVELFKQLKEGGRLAAVENAGRVGAARLYVKRGEHVSSRFGFNASIKPLPGFTAPVEFAF